MNVSDALRTIIAKRGKTQACIAKELGVSQPAIASVLAVGNPQTRVLEGLLGTLDYRLVAVPTDYELPEDAYVLEVKRND